MTETVLDKPTLDRIDPEHVVPMVTFLAHESNNLTGKCYEVGGGNFSEVEIFSFKVSRFMLMCRFGFSDPLEEV